MKSLRSVAALLVGIAIVFALSAGTDLLLEHLNIFPAVSQRQFAVWMLLVALSYRCLFAIAAGYITATIAAKKRMRHVTILGYIALIVSIVGVITNWDKPNQWYAVAVAITCLPCIWLGGKIKKTLKSMRQQ